MQVSRHESSSGLSPPAGGEVSAGQARLQAEAQAGLLAGLRRKDKAAFAMVIEQYSPMLTKAAWLYLGSPHDAEDAVQETFLAAWDAAARTRDSTSLSHWLWSILMNRCRKHIRSAQRRRRRETAAFRQHAAGTGPEGAGAGPEAADAAGRLGAVQDALAALCPDHRETVILRYFRGLGVEEAGAAMGVPAGTVKSRCHAALAQLRSRLEERT
jgi:RNA polymerase sigma-70 factor (ECF subfamily)